MLSPHVCRTGSTFGPLPNKLVRARLFAYEGTIVVATVTNNSGTTNNGPGSSGFKAAHWRRAERMVSKYAGTRLAPLSAPPIATPSMLAVNPRSIYKENP